MKYTKGPWKVQKLNHAEGDPWYQIGLASGWGPIARINCTAEKMPDGCVAELKYLTASEDEQFANARLIAAAPELLEACAKTKFFIDGEYASLTAEQYERRYKLNEISYILDNAIRRAKGE